MADNTSVIFNKLITEIVTIFKNLIKQKNICRPNLISFATFASFNKIHKKLINIINDIIATYDISDPINYKYICDYIKLGASECDASPDISFYMSNINIFFGFLMDDTLDYSWQDYVFMCNKTLIDILITNNEKTPCLCGISDNHFKLSNELYCENGTHVKEEYTKSLKYMMDITRYINVGFLPGEYITRRYKSINGMHELKYIEQYKDYKIDLENYPDWNDEIAKRTQEMAELDLEDEPTPKRKPFYILKMVGCLNISENSAFKRIN